MLLSLNFCLLVWGISLFAVVSAAYFSQSLSSKLSNEAQAAALQVQEKQGLIKALTDARATRQPDATLLSAIEAGQDDIEIKQTIVDELASREAQKSHGFSDLMLDLAKNHQQQLWLTRIRMESGRLHIEGSALDSAAVPIWVSQLGEADYFNGREFAAARMYRDEEQQLNFVLSSELNDPTVGVQP